MVPAHLMKKEILCAKAWKSTNHTGAWISSADQWSFSVRINLVFLFNVWILEKSDQRTLVTTTTKSTVQIRSVRFESTIKICSSSTALKFKSCYKYKYLLQRKGWWSLLVCWLSNLLRASELVLWEKLCDQLETFLQTNQLSVALIISKKPSNSRELSLSR